MTPNTQPTASMHIRKQDDKEKHIRLTTNSTNDDDPELIKQQRIARLLEGGKTPHQVLSYNLDPFGNTALIDTDDILGSTLHSQIDKYSKPNEEVVLTHVDMSEFIEPVNDRVTLKRYGMLSRDGRAREKVEIK